MPHRFGRWLLDGLTVPVFILFLCLASLIATLLASYGQGAVSTWRAFSILIAVGVGAQALWEIRSNWRARRLRDDAGADPVVALKAELSALKEENARTMAMLEGRFADVRLVSFNDGKLDVSSGMIPCMAEYLAQMLQGDPARPDGSLANYVEMTLHHPEVGELVLTLQRASGKNPHQMRREAEDRLAALT